MVSKQVIEDFCMAWLKAEVNIQNSTLQMFKEIEQMLAVMHAYLDKIVGNHSRLDKIVGVFKAGLLSLADPVCD